MKPLRVGIGTRLSPIATPTGIAWLMGPGVPFTLPKFRLKVMVRMSGVHTAVSVPVWVTIIAPTCALLESLPSACRQPEKTWPSRTGIGTRLTPISTPGGSVTKTSAVEPFTLPRFRHILAEKPPNFKRLTVFCYFSALIF